MPVLFTSDEFFRLARNAYERSKTYPPEAIVALILSVTSFEAFLNEMVETASGSSLMEDEPEEVKAFAAILGDLEDQRAQINLKIQVAHCIFKKKRLDRGELPYQDFDLLMRIRNALVHKRPEKWDWVSGQQTFEPNKLVKRLVDRKIISRPPPTEPPQLFIPVSCPEVARWSCNVVVQMARFLVDLVPPSRLRESLSWWEAIDLI